VGGRREEGRGGCKQARREKREGSVGEGEAGGVRKEEKKASINTKHIVVQDGLTG